MENYQQKLKNKYREEYFPQYPPSKPITQEEAMQRLFAGLWAACDEEKKR